MPNEVVPELIYHPSTTVEFIKGEDLAEEDLERVVVRPLSNFLALRIAYVLKATHTDRLFHALLG